MFLCCNMNLFLKEVNIWITFLICLPSELRTWEKKDCPGNDNSKPRSVKDWPGVPISSFLIICTFDGMCEEFQESGIKTNYTWIELHTKTSTSGTGPDSTETGCYIYAEASYGKENDTASLTSGTFSSSFSTYCLDFKYHMHGPDIGSLAVILTGKKKPVFKQYGPKNTSSWFREKLELSVEPDSEFRITFSATRGNGAKGDIALDNIYLLKGNCERGTWGDWSNWSCSCGKEKRYRECLSDPCYGDTRDYRLCSGPVCQEGWSAWSEWRSCLCGSNPVRVRLRRCAHTPCQGRAFETEPCASNACPKWTTWSRWTCVVTCGKGSKTRTRVCVGQGCPGNAKETGQCRMRVCPEWQPWSSWTCSVTCGTGERERRRSCNGDLCPGSDSETGHCVPMACPGRWGVWSVWKCDVTCGIGIQVRRRSCETATPCSGDDEEQGKCILADCPVHWANWSPWSACDRSCGYGSRSRVRACPTNSCHGDAKESERCLVRFC